MKNYDVLLEQRRAVVAKVAADNQKDAKDRAKELLEDGALDEGFGLPPDFLSKFKIKVVAVKEQKR